MLCLKVLISYWRESLGGNDDKKSNESENRGNFVSEIKRRWLLPNTIKGFFGNVFSHLYGKQVFRKS